MKKSRFIVVIISIILLVMTSIIIYCVTPHKYSLTDFEKLESGDNFVMVMLKLGRPSEIMEGGTGLLHFGYELPDDSYVYLTFGKGLISLETCVRYKDNKIIDVYVSKNNKICK